MGQLGLTAKEIGEIVAQEGAAAAEARLGRMLFAVNAADLEEDEAAPLPFRTTGANIVDAAEAVAGGARIGMIYLPVVKGSSPYDDISLGRARNCDIVLRAPSVSKLHAKIRIEGNGLRITDVGSSNGTFLGDTRLPKGLAMPLAVNQRVRFGEIDADLVSLLRFLR